ncbi:hypothetical protein [Kineococcus rubinsiae]|uniref:hypothetical protein n=1 Tax=Kineococcus rubinsiae TaxID=2609562 RepID=UPI00142FE4E2|nr:hypothetical protein [Kineococcus rubinsiae]NIZ89534.1 hypothetical protein [Kineococcus rubinsiae]
MDDERTTLSQDEDELAAIDEIDAAIEAGVADLDHEYAVYLRVHTSAGFDGDLLAGLVADLGAAHPRLEDVDLPEHDLVVSVDADGLDAEGAAQEAHRRVLGALAGRGLQATAVEATVLSDAAAWTFDAETTAGW